MNTVSTTRTLFATDATPEPAAVTPPAFGERWGVYRRPRPRGKWSLIAHVGSEDAARELMFRLMDTHRGHADWRVGRLGEQDTPQGAIAGPDSPEGV